jgi:hypothetical protein
MTTTWLLMFEEPQSSFLSSLSKEESAQGIK